VFPLLHFGHMFWRFHRIASSWWASMSFCTTGSTNPTQTFSMCCQSFKLYPQGKQHFWAPEIYIKPAGTSLLSFLNLMFPAKKT